MINKKMFNQETSKKVKNHNTKNKGNPLKIRQQSSSVSRSQPIPIINGDYEKMPPRLSDSNTIDSTPNSTGKTTIITPSTEPVISKSQSLKTLERFYAKKFQNVCARNRKRSRTIKGLDQEQGQIKIETKQKQNKVKLTRNGEFHYINYKTYTTLNIKHVEGTIRTKFSKQKNKHRTYVKVRQL